MRRVLHFAMLLRCALFLPACLRFLAGAASLRFVAIAMPACTASVRIGCLARAFDGGDQMRGRRCPARGQPTRRHTMPIIRRPGPVRADSTGSRGVFPPASTGYDGEEPIHDARAFGGTDQVCINSNNEQHPKIAGLVWWTADSPQHSGKKPGDVAFKNSPPALKRGPRVSATPCITSVPTDLLPAARRCLPDKSCMGKKVIISNSILLPLACWT